MANVQWPNRLPVPSRGGVRRSSPGSSLQHLHKPTNVGNRPTDLGYRPTDVGYGPTDLGYGPIDVGNKPTEPTSVTGQPTPVTGQPTLLTSIVSQKGFFGPKLPVPFFPLSFKTSHPWFGGAVSPPVPAQNKFPTSLSPGRRGIPVQRRGPAGHREATGAPWGVDRDPVRVVGWPWTPELRGAPKHTPIEGVGDRPFRCVLRVSGSACPTTQSGQRLPPLDGGLHPSDARPYHARLYP